MVSYTIEKGETAMHILIVEDQFSLADAMKAALEKGEIYGSDRCRRRTRRGRGVVGCV